MKLRMKRRSAPGSVEIVEVTNQFPQVHRVLTNTLRDQPASPSGNPEEFEDAVAFSAVLQKPLVNHTSPLLLGFQQHTFNMRRMLFVFGDVLPQGYLFNGNFRPLMRQVCRPVNFPLPGLLRY